MPQVQYRITSEDRIHARFYIDDQLKSLMIEFKKDVERSEAIKAWQTINASKYTADQLQNWCDRFVSKSSWSKLRIAVRKRRQRWNRVDETKTVTISIQAYNLLRRISERDQATFSEVLEKVLARNLANAQGALARRRNPK